MTKNETPLRTATCPHAGCPWTLDIFGQDEEAVEADHAEQHDLFDGAGNYEPESSYRNADVIRERDCDDWPLGVGVLR